MHQKDVDNLQRVYTEKGLVQHPELIKSIQRTLKAVPVELPKQKLQDKLLEYMVLPLFGELDVYMHAVEHGTISEEQGNKLKLLERLYQSLSKEKPYQQIMATDLEDTRKKIIRFDPHTNSPSDLKYILIQNGVCYADKRRLDDIVNTFYVDALLGGSVIITLEGKDKCSRDYATDLKRKDRRDKSIISVGKFFICVNKDQNPIIAIDHYGYGNYHSKSLGEWQENGKIDTFAFGPSAVLYLAERLGISRIAYCDLEMAEFAKQCGLGRKQVFKPMDAVNGPKFDDRKAGIISVGDNSKGIWHHKHSIYHQTNGRYFTLDYEPVTIKDLLMQFEVLRSEIELGMKNIGSGHLTISNHSKLRIKERFTAMYTILRIMEETHLVHPYFNQAKQNYNFTINSVTTRNPSFSLPYVK